MAYLLSLIVNGVTRLQNDTHGTNIYADKHIKNNSNDNYILLGGGGHIDKGTFALANHGVHWEGFTKRATSSATWGTLISSNGYTPLFWLDSTSGGGVAFSDKGGQTFMQIDGYFYQNEGKNRVTDVTETVTALGTSGNYLTWTKNGTTSNITVPYASASDYSNYTKSLNSVGLPSSTSNAANTVWCKFATLTFNASAWCNASGYFFFSGGESTDHNGILAYHFRASSTATAISMAELTWLTKRSSNQTVIAVKTADNVYDLYVNNLSTWCTPRIYHFSAFNDRFKWNVGSWSTTKPTASYTSTDVGRVYYATNAGNADTVDSIHADRFAFIYNSANYNNSSALTVNEMAANANSNAHMGMIHSGTDNPVSSSGNWIHVWSQSWTRGTISSWVSQIALGVQQGTGMWYRTTSGAITGKAWTRVIDSSNITGYYWANVNISASSSTSTYPTFGSLAVINDSCNNNNDSLAYFQHRSNNDWTVKVDSGSYDYGLNIAGAQTATNALSVTGGSRFTNTLRIGNGSAALDGNYCEGIRIRAADSTWATIILGATADTGTNAYAWSIHRTSGNNFSISRNSSDGANGLLINTDGKVGIGTTSPSERLSVNGWVGTIGATGWYNITYAGGIHMSDATWVRVYNNKKFYVANNEYNAIHSAGGVYVAGMVHSYANYLKSTNNGKYVMIGPQNASHAHYETDATTSHWFNKRVDVNGAIWRYGTNYGIDSDGYFYAKAVYANRDGSNTGGGVSLYSNSDPMTYGIAFRGTGTYGTKGRVQSDWATYLTMSDTTNRGWIFRRGSTNVASVSGEGIAYFEGVGRDTYIAYPSGATFTYGSGSITGVIKITLPVKACSTMMHMKITIYNYVDETSSTYHVAGYNYSDGNWYNCTAYSLRQGANGYGNLRVRFGNDGSKDCIYIGETSTVWSYPNVVVSDVLIGHSTQSHASWSGGWSITVTTSLGTIKKEISNPALNYYSQHAGNSDTVDNQHATRFPWIYNSANILTSTSVTCNDIAADANSNAHMGMIYASTNNPTGATKWVHVWSQTWNRGNISSWVSQIALGVQDGTGMWYRTTSGALASKGWTRVIDSANIGSQSVNYATSAGNADTVDSKHASDFTYNINGGNVDCNTTGTHSAVYRFGASPTNAFPNASWSNMLIIGAGSDTMTQIGAPYNVDELYFRRGTWDSTAGSIRTNAWKTILHSGNYTSYVNNYYWANVKISTTSNTATYPTFANMKSTGRVYLDEWIQFSSGTGLYWPNTNGAHLYANTTTSYAGLMTQGARNGYCGLHCGPNTNYMTVMSTDVHHGLYCENTGVWEFYYNRSSSGVGIRTSSITKNFNVNGQSYLSSNVWIGTTSGGEMLNVGGWVGTTGNTGWYNITHQGGMFMQDTTYVRTYNNKALYVSNSGQHAIYTAGGFASSLTNGHILSTYYNSNWYTSIATHGNGNLSISPPSGSLYLAYNYGNTYFGGGTYFVDRAGNLGSDSVRWNTIWSKMARFGWHETWNGNNSVVNVVNDSSQNNNSDGIWGVRVSGVDTSVGYNSYWNGGLRFDDRYTAGSIPETGIMTSVTGKNKTAASFSCSYGESVYISGSDLYYQGSASTSYGSRLGLYCNAAATFESGVAFYPTTGTGGSYMSGGYSPFVIVNTTTTYTLPASTYLTNGQWVVLAKKNTSNNSYTAGSGTTFCCCWDGGSRSTTSFSHSSRSYMMFYYNTVWYVIRFS
jgi:hypothetical protein